MSPTDGHGFIELNALTHPRSVDRFLAEVWGRTELFTSRPPALADSICQHIGATQLRDFLRLGAGSVLVMHYTREGVYRATPVPKTVAYSFYRCGATLYFDLHPDLRPTIDTKQQLAQDLGTKPEFVKLSIFASPRDAVTEWHFDANENFTIQLHGQKRWHVSPPTVVHPLERFTATDKCPPSLTGRETEFQDVISSLDEKSTTYSMEYGATSYVPRGAWHKVEAITDSISLNVCISPETWEEVVISALRKRLLADQYWRQTATDIGTRDPGSPETVNRILAMIDRLVSDASDLTVDEVLALR